MTRNAAICDADVTLGDARLDRRLATIVSALEHQPGGSIPACCGSRGATKAAYRFFSNDTVRPEQIIESHARGAMRRIAPGSRVLVIQDTTEITLTGLKATQGLGTLDGRGQMGIKMHTALMSSTDGEPLGILHERMWTRPLEEYGKRNRRKQRPRAAKESIRWEETARHVDAMLPADVATVMVADREADIFSVFTQERRPGSDLLIRVSYNRRVAGPHTYLHDAVAAAPVLGTMRIAVPRGPARKEREAHLDVRATTVAIEPPQEARRRSTIAPVRVQIVLAQERDRPGNEPLLQWMLLTTMPVATFADAQQMIRWYKLRWLIERFHYTLKQGCKVEELQLEHVDRLQRAIAVYALVAWRMLWIRYHSTLHPDASCETVLEPDEWKALYCLYHRTNKPPVQAPPVHEAVGWIARIGGFLGRARDGEPGVKTIWRGLQKLETATAMFRAFVSSAT